MVLMIYPILMMRNLIKRIERVKINIRLLEKLLRNLIKRIESAFS